jgi:predicted nucleic acid-binding protein
VTPRGFLADTSALVRILRDQDLFGFWEQPIGDGLVATCAAVELELLHSARSKSDRDEIVELLQTAFVWVDMPYRAFARAAEIQAALTDVGAHRSASTVDLLVAATAELHGLILLHHDHDFEQIARVTGQRIAWLAPVD